MCIRDSITDGQRLRVAVAHLPQQQLGNDTGENQEDDVRPVSYTHLDVYTRQLQDLLPFHLGPEAQTNPVENQKIFYGTHPAIITQEAVSYTHLDVYKRQYLCRHNPHRI